MGVSDLASHKTKIQILTRRAVNSRLYRRWISLQPHPQGCWQALGPWWLLAWDISCLPHGFVFRAAHNRHLASFRASQWQNEKDSTPNGNHLLFVTHNLYCILLAKSKSLNPTHTLEEGITKRYEHQEEGVVRAISEAAYHTMQRAGREYLRQKEEKMQWSGGRHPIVSEEANGNRMD